MMVDGAMVTIAVLAVVALVRYRMFVKAVERYREAVGGDHAKVLEYAETMRPGTRERPPAG